MGLMRWAVGLWLHITSPVAYMMDTLVPGPGCPYSGGLIMWAMDNLHEEDE